jgi:hypothetical protein
MSIVFITHNLLVVGFVLAVISVAICSTFTFDEIFLP